MSPPRASYPRLGPLYKGYPELGPEYGSHPSGTAAFANISAPATASEGADPAISAMSGDSGLSLTLVDVSPVVDVNIQTGVTTPYATTYPDITPGTRQVRFFNEANPSEFTSTATITVSAQAPTVTSPTNGASFTVGDVVTFDADGSAGGWDANTTSVEFYVDGALVATAASPTLGVWSATWNTTGATPGTGLPVVARRYWVGLAGETGSVDSTGTLDIDLASGIGPADPLTIITSVSPFFFLSGDLGITLATGVSAWADQSGNANDAEQITPGNQPAYNPTGLNGHGTLLGDGSNDRLGFTTLDLPAPGTTNWWFFAVFRQISWTSNDSVYGGGTTTTARIQATGASPNLRALNSATVGSGNTGAALNTWVRLENLFSNTTADYLKLGTTSVTGINTGNTDPALGAFALMAHTVAGAGAANMEIACFGCWQGAPTGAEKAALDAWVTAYYGGTVTV